MSERDELLLLRELVKKQQQELEQKENKISEQTAQIERQEIKIENLTQALLQARKELFGASSEVTKQVNGQLHLFKTVEELTRELYKEQKEITIKGHHRVPRKPGVRAEMLETLPEGNRGIYHR